MIFQIYMLMYIYVSVNVGGGRDRMAVEFTTSSVIIVYYQKNTEF